LDREYLEDYEQKEKEEYSRVIKRIMDDSFSFEKDRYPPNERFFKIQKPVARMTSVGTTLGDFWVQVPFSGSLVLMLPPCPLSDYERDQFKESEIPALIDFIKETGKIQVVLNCNPTRYEGLDHLNPFFKELKPPVVELIPLSILGNETEIREAYYTFDTLAEIRFYSYMRNTISSYYKEEPTYYHSKTFSLLRGMFARVYVVLKLQCSTRVLAEEIENSLIDNPEIAWDLLGVCQDFIVNSFMNMTYDVANYSKDWLAATDLLPLVFRPREIRFPFEIGRCLLKKLTYAPKGLRACHDILDHYNNYDLQRVFESLNEAITTNHPDIVERKTSELSEILDNIWDDQTIPKRIEGIKVGLPLSIAAIGGVAGGLLAGQSGMGTGGFLAGLGFKIAEKAADKIFGVKGEGITEKLAKLGIKSYQANVYDFKKKYKHQIKG